MNRKVLRHQLERLGMDCVLAENGAKALALMADRVFDIVITDCAMPVMDGLELTRRLRALEAEGRPRSMVIALTAHAGSDSAARCHEAGADIHLAKPLQLAELAEALQRRHREDFPPFVSCAAVATEVPAGDSASPVDRAALAAIIGDEDPRLLRRVMQEFLSAWEESLYGLRRLLEKRDAVALAEAAHAAKGLTRYGAATRLAADCSRLERLAHAREWIDVAATIEALERETRRLQEHLMEAGDR